jgi:hypothetical protein
MMPRCDKASEPAVPRARDDFERLHHMVNAAKKSAEPTVIEVHDSARWLGKLRAIAGSKNDDWNNIIANQVVSALWLKNSDTEEAKK